MNGLWIHDARTARFSDYAPTLLPQWDTLWWMIGGRAEVDSNWWVDDENEAFLEASEILALQGRPFSRLWRPGSMQKMAWHLMLDEWSYFCGINGPDLESVEPRARHLDENGALMYLPDEVENRAEILILDVDDGLLFIFSPREDWLDVLAAQSQNAQRISPQDWQNWLRRLDG